MNNTNARHLIADFLIDPDGFRNQLDLLNLFFNGASLDLLKPLFSNPDPRVRSLAMFVTVELGSKSAKLLPWSSKLVNDTLSGIRHDVYDHLLLAANGDYVQYFPLLLKGLNDQEELLRCQTRDLLANASPEQLRTAGYSNKGGS